MEDKYDQYHNYSVSQFVENEHFQQWVIYVNKEDDKFWTDYLCRHPQQRQKIADARKKVNILFKASGQKPLSSLEKLILKNAIFLHICQPVPPYKFIRQKTIQFLKFTVIISVIILSPIYLVNKIGKKSILITEPMGANEVKKITLPDRTIVP